MTRTDELNPSEELVAVPRRVWAVTWVVVLGAFMAALDSSLVNLGLDTISQSLDASLTSVQWVSTGYLLALGGALPMSAWLGRRLGTGSLWLASLSVFTAASLLCALLPDLTMLILMRLVQGLAGGLLVPAGQAVIGQAAGRARLGRVMSTAGIAVILAPALGPTIGGLLIQAASWHWLFLINVPLGAIALILGSAIMPRDRGAKAPLDIPGLLLLGGGLPTLSYGIIRASTPEGLHSAQAIVTLSTGLLALVLYVVLSRRRTNPILSLTLFHDRVFSSASIAVFFSGASLFGGVILLPLYFEILRDKSVIETGLLLLVLGGGSVASMRVGGRMTDMYGGGLVATVGLAIAVVTTLPLAFMGVDADLRLVEAILFLRGIGIGLAGMPLMSAAFATAPRDLMPHATAEINILQRVAGAVGSGVYVSILVRGGSPSLDSFHAAFLWLTLTSLVGLLAAAWVAVESRCAVSRRSRRVRGRGCPDESTAPATSANR